MIPSFKDFPHLNYELLGLFLATARHAALSPQMEVETWVRMPQEVKPEPVVTKAAEPEPVVAEEPEVEEEEQAVVEAPVAKKPSQQEEEVEALRQRRQKTAEANARREAQFLAQLEAAKKEVRLPFLSHPTGALHTCVRSLAHTVCHIMRVWMEAFQTSPYASREAGVSCVSLVAAGGCKEAG